MLKRRLLIMLCGAALLLLTVLPAGATTSTYSSYAGDGPAFVYIHDKFEVTFTVPVAGEVRIWTHSMYPEGTVLNPGIPLDTPDTHNFNPWLWVWNGTTDSATVLAMGDTVQLPTVVDYNTQIFPTTSGSQVFNFTRNDAGVVIPNCPAGTYIVSLVIQGNEPYDLTYTGVGRAWGFVYDDYVLFGQPADYVPLATYGEGFNGDWRLSIAVPAAASVPIPGSVILLGTGLAGLLLGWRKRS
jgi:hypothetical protein